jgi:hypothetical protein
VHIFTLKRFSLSAGLLLVACLAPRAAGAEILGVYVGAAVGRANVKVDTLPVAGFPDFNETNFGWKVQLGVRALKVLGAEAEYVDLGHPSATRAGVSADVRSRGPALFAVGYLPIPLPLLDVYAKLGYARIENVGNASAFGGSLPVHFDATDRRFAWGIGAQIKLPVTPLAVRAEYERFHTGNGDPHFTSLGLIWRF